MKNLDVIQHTSADYLGLMEDHFEGRRIRFRYTRPFTEKGRVPAVAECGDGLVLLGGGPWGTAGGRDLPTLAEEVELARAFLELGRPVIGIELGAQILCLAAGGGSVPAPLTFEVGQAHRSGAEALKGFMPEVMPHVYYMRDWPVLPECALTLATDDRGRPAVFQVGDNAIGFTGHPGFKPAMAEDLIMEFEESPENPAPQLERMQRMSKDIEDALVPVMTGIIKITGLMQIRRRIPLELKG